MSYPHKLFRGVVATLALLAGGVILPSPLSNEALATGCTFSTYYHITGSDGKDYINSTRPINGGDACFAGDTTEAWSVASQDVVDPNGKIVAYPDTLYGCQWGGASNVDLDCSTGFTPTTVCRLIGTSCGTQQFCKVNWTESAAGAVTGTQADGAFDLWTSSASTPQWSSITTETIVQMNRTGLTSGYTSWPIATVNGVNYYWNETDVVNGGTNGEGNWRFFQFIRKVLPKDTVTNFNLGLFLSWEVTNDASKAPAASDYYVSTRAGWEIKQKGTGLTGGPLTSTTHC